jgi:hypothetical protein
MTTNGKYYVFFRVFDIQEELLFAHFRWLHILQRET